MLYLPDVEHAVKVLSADNFVVIRVITQKPIGATANVIPNCRVHRWREVLRFRMNSKLKEPNLPNVSV